VNPWDAILSLDLDRTPRRSWNRLGEAAVPLFPLLKPVGAIARHVNCEQCGCNHQVVSDSDAAKVVAVCRCETPICDDMRLDREEASLVAVDLKKLAAKLVEPLPVVSRPERIGNTSAWKLGQVKLRHDGEEGVLIACLSGNGNAIRNAALAVSAGKLGRAVFVCKTTRPRCVESLLPTESGVVGFEDVWTLDGDQFSWAKSAKKLFTGWDDDALLVPKARFDSVQFAFRKRGEMWEVVYEGKAPFFITDTLGARYIDNLLHHPNDPISSFDLEVAVTPEKAEARGETTIQSVADPGAVKSYLKALTANRGEREGAAADGDEAEVRRLDDEIEALEAAIKKAEGGGASDRGERARMNVGKAIAAVRRKLASGTAVEKSFAKHLKDALSTGYDCAYHSAAGRIWQ
jgi:hypothetical protein